MKHILCFGDSNTWGYDGATYDPATGIAKRMDYEMRWTGVMQKKLGENYRVIENALNGRTCMHEDPYSPHRLGLCSLEEALEANAPLDLVILKLGVNELKSMFSLTAGMISYGMEKLVQTAQTSCYGYPIPKVLLIAPHPVSKDIDRARFGFAFGPLAHLKSIELAALYCDIADRYGCEFIDCSELRFTLDAFDGLHYTREDHAKLANAATGKVLKMLQSTQQI